MIILDCIQGSDEWAKARVGVVSASKFGEILTPLGKPTTGVKRPNYMNTLIAETIMGYKMDSYCNDDMKRGIELEPVARDMYSMINDVEVEEIGMAYLDDRKLISCSPDGLVNENGLWENKAPKPHTHIKYRLDNKIPTQYIPQVQGQMWVMEREYCDFMSYCPDIKPFIIRVNRDDDYIATLSGAVEKFVSEMQEKLEKLK